MTEDEGAVIDETGPEPDTEPAIYFTYEDAIILMAAAKDQLHVMKDIIDDMKSGDYGSGEACLAIGLASVHDKLYHILRNNQGQMYAAQRESRGY